jgi:cell division protein FtsL
MLETRLPYSSPSTLPRHQARPAPRRVMPAVAPVHPGRAVPRPAVPRRVARRTLVLSRLARSEARMLTVAVAVATLMCATLVIYLAAYAHVTYLGLEQAAAHRQLNQEISANHRLQVEQANLQDRGRIVNEALKMHMTLYTGPTTYVTAPTADAQPNAGGINGGTTTDANGTTGGH